MKNYEEMANDVFRRINDYEIKRKKKRKILAAGLLSMTALAVCVLISVFAKRTDELTFEQIMSAPNVESNGPDGFEYESFNDMISDHQSRGLDPTVVFGRVTKVTYYLSWNKEDMTVSGYTVTELSVKDVNEAYNGLSLSENESISLRQNYYIGFKNTADFFVFMFANVQNKLKDQDDLANVDSFVLQLTPSDGTEYVKYIRENEMPMKPGEDYSMVVYRLEGPDELGCSYIMSDDEALSYSALNREYGLSFSSSYTSIANEIGAFFTE